MNSSVGHPKTRTDGGLVTALVLLCLLSACSEDTEPIELSAKETSPGAVHAVAPQTPRLFLLLVVDQMRGDYLDRLAPLLDSGLARLRREGQVFTDAEQDHATTSTSPGHATIATGTYPSTHGIVNNNWFDRESGEEIYSVEDARYGRSPLRLLVPTIGDRLKQHWPQAKVFAVGGKDRSTILTAGKAADGAYWYNPRSGEFTTSTFYSPNIESDGMLPDWLGAFHQQHWLDQLFGTAWEPTYSLRELRQAGVTGVEPLDRGDFSRTFPYPFGGRALNPGRSFYSAIYTSPWLDQYTGQMAAALIEGESLGQDAIPDMLPVDFSATDAVGHTFGPDSPELIDTQIRLDKTIGRLLDFVDQYVGLDNVVIALSSDHGVGQVPEVAKSRGRDAARLGTEAALCVQRLGLQLSQQFGLAWSRWMPALFYFDQEVLAQHSVDIDEIRVALAEGLQSCPRVDRVVVPKDLDHSTEDPLLTLYQHSFLKDRSPDLFVQLAPDTLATSTTASHGTTHRYDRWIPMLFRIPGFPAQEIKEPASATDIAPTIAGVLGIPGADYDGLNRLPQLEGGDARWQDPE